VSNNVDKRIGS